MLFRVTKEGAFLLFLLPYMKLWRPNCRRNHLVLAYFILAYRSSVQQRRLHKRIREQVRKYKSKRGKQSKTLCVLTAFTEVTIV